MFSKYTSRRIRFVRAGTLDDPSAVAPDVHIYTRSKLPWVTLPDSVPAFEVYYETKELWPAANLERLEGSGVPASVIGDELVGRGCRRGRFRVHVGEALPPPRESTAPPRSLFCCY